MLSNEAVEQWCWRLGLSDEAKAVITQVRTSPPVRHVQREASNVSGTHPSLKMGCALRFESHRDELPFAYLMDHDPQVLEFIALYLQAEQVALTQRHIGRYLAPPAIVRDPKVRALLREVCREVETRSEDEAGDLVLGDESCQAAAFVLWWRWTE